MSWCPIATGHLANRDESWAIYVMCMLIILMNMRTVTWFSHGNNRIPLRPMISQGQCSTNWATRVRDLIPTAISIQGQWSTNWATCSLVPRRSNKIREEVCACAAPQAFLGSLETTVILVRVTPGIHCLCMCGFPGFSGELGNYCDTSPCCMTIRYWITGVVTSWRSSVHSTKLYRVPSVRLESQEWHWRTNNWCQYRTFMARTCLYCYQLATYVYLLFVFVSHIHFGKAEMAYHHHGLASYSSARCSYTLEL